MMYKIIYCSNYKINTSTFYFYKYVNCKKYYCEAFEKKQKELKHIKINENENIIELLKKIKLQNEMLLYHIHNINIVKIANKNDDKCKCMITKLIKDIDKT